MKSAEISNGCLVPDEILSEVSFHQLFTSFEQTSYISQVLNVSNFQLTMKSILWWARDETRDLTWLMRGKSPTRTWKKDEEESSFSEEESGGEFDPNDSDDDVKKKGFMAKKPPTKRKAPVGRGWVGALKKPMPSSAKMSEYKKIRQGNITERESILQELIADFDNFKKDSGIGAAKKAPPEKRKRVEYDSDDEGGFHGNKARVEGFRKSVRLSEEQPRDVGGEAWDLQQLQGK